jgi:hypothetical protein
MVSGCPAECVPTEKVWLAGDVADAIIGAMAGTATAATVVAARMSFRMGGSPWFFRVRAGGPLGGVAPRSAPPTRPFKSVERRVLGFALR